MTKILFVCYGNICRSPMAEFILKDMVEKLGIADSFYIKSAATSREEIGNPVYPPVRRILQNMGIDTNGKYAVQVKAEDYEIYDYIVCMDNLNLRNIKRIIPEDYDNKISLFLGFAGEHRDVADPWYTGDFETCKTDVINGCKALLKEIQKQNGD